MGDLGGGFSEGELTARWRQHVSTDSTIDEHPGGMTMRTKVEGGPKPVRIGKACRERPSNQRSEQASRRQYHGIVMTRNGCNWSRLVKSYPRSTPSWSQKVDDDRGHGILHMLKHAGYQAPLAEDVQIISYDHSIMRLH